MFASSSFYRNKVTPTINNSLLLPRPTLVTNGVPYSLIAQKRNSKLIQKTNDGKIKIHSPGPLQIEDCILWIADCNLNLQYAICSPQSISMQSAIHNLQSTIQNLQSTTCNLQSMICNLQSTIYNLQSTTCNLQSTIYNLQIYNLQSTICNLQPATCNLHV